MPLTVHLARSRPALSPATAMELSPGDEGLFLFGRWLHSQGYRFTTATPETHRRVQARAPRHEAGQLREAFGWSQPFRPSLLPAEALDWLDRANALEREDGGLLRSKLRFSTLDDLLLAHSAWPTLQPDSVFFGPDTYRYAAFIRQCLSGSQRHPLRCIVDVGCGSGAGGFVAERFLRPQPGRRLVLSDINPQALRLARVNAVLAGIPHAECLLSDVLRLVQGTVDLVLANPPYLADPLQRGYRDGGGDLGTGLALRIVEESLLRLSPGGRLILYSGAPIVAGEDLLRSRLQPLLEGKGLRCHYQELDPDVFGEELDANPAYADVERIAAVGLFVQLP